MLDARAPVEFNKGSFPGVVNLPLMNDDERQRVGLCYKQHGPASGHHAGPSIGERANQSRARPGLGRFRPGPSGWVLVLFSRRLAFADRRSNGSRTRRVSTIRAWPAATRPCAASCWTRVDQAVAQCDFVVLGGMTGTGKTDVLTQIAANGLDLEGHANHRGSSFGKRATEPAVRHRFREPPGRGRAEEARPRHRAVRAGRREPRGRAVARCRCRCIRACSSFRWSGWKTAWKDESNAFCAITWWTCGRSSSACMAMRASRCFRSALLVSLNNCAEATGRRASSADAILMEDGAGGAGVQRSGGFASGLDRRVAARVLRPDVCVSAGEERGRGSSLPGSGLRCLSICESGVNQRG